MNHSACQIGSSSSCGQAHTLPSANIAICKMVIFHSFFVNNRKVSTPIQKNLWVYNLSTHIKSQWKSPFSGWNLIPLILTIKNRWQSTRDPPYRDPPIVLRRNLGWFVPSLLEERIKGTKKNEAETESKPLNSSYILVIYIYILGYISHVFVPPNPSSFSPTHLGLLGPQETRLWPGSCEGWHSMTYLIYLTISN